MQTHQFTPQHAYTPAALSFFDLLKCDEDDSVFRLIDMEAGFIVVVLDAVDVWLEFKDRGEDNDVTLDRVALFMAVFFSGDLTKQR